MNHQAIFTPQYAKASGPGSTEAYSAPYRTFLEAFIRDHDIQSIVDLGCGDLEIMSRVDLQGARYEGFDCVEERVWANRLRHPSLSCTHFDARQWAWPECDLLLVKDVLQHWSNGEVVLFLQDLLAHRSSFRYALLTNCNYGATVNQNITTGGWRALDLLAAPFSVPGAVVFQWETKDVVKLVGTL